MSNREAICTLPDHLRPKAPEQEPEPDGGEPLTAEDVVRMAGSYPLAEVGVAMKRAGVRVVSVTADDAQWSIVLLPVGPEYARRVHDAVHDALAEEAAREGP